MLAKITWFTGKIFELSISLISVTFGQQKHGD